MTKEEIGFTQGVGWAIAFMVGCHREDSYGEQLLGESGIPFSDFEKCCDEHDLQHIREINKKMA